MVGFGGPTGQVREGHAHGYDFSRVPRADIPRSVFDRSHGVKTTFDAGYIVPIFRDMVFPGDTINLNMVHLARINTLIAPLMHRVFVDTHFFAVPMRLLWDNWEKFMGAQDNPGDPAGQDAYTVPMMTAPSGGYAAQSLQDYLGIPLIAEGFEHSALFTRAYNLIWNEWYRDENLQDSVTVDTGNGPDDPADYVLLRRGKRHDYFTSCLPDAQKGSAVELPLGVTAPLTITGTGTPTFTFSGASSGSPSSLSSPHGAPSPIQATNTLGGAGPSTVAWDTPALGGTADLSSATAATINAIRLAFQTQRLLERDMRGGTRYTELIRSHFGVTSPDFRLQRPEYLGGGSSLLDVHPVPQTSANSGASFKGDLGSYGTSTGDMHVSKSFTEHCVVLGFSSVRVDQDYQHGLDRQFSYEDRYDFYLPVFAHLGEQAVRNKEIWCQGTPGGTDDDETFGYQERWAEMRYKPNLITGKMRSDAPGSLDLWHLAQYWLTLPQLNASFIEEDPPMARAIKVTSEPHFRYEAFFNYKHVRPMPVYSVPGMVDHL